MIATLEYYKSSSTTDEIDIFSQMHKTIYTLSEYEREAYEERAAIMEFSGGLSQEEAEWQALQITIKNQMRIAG